MRKASAAFFALLATILGLGVVARPAVADDPTTSVPLKEAHRGIAQDDPDFNGTDCGGLDPAHGAVWHFIANQLAPNTPAGTITAYFGPSANNPTETETAGAATVLTSTQHFFVQSTEDVLIDAFAVFAGEQPDAKLVLSHICPRPESPDPAATVTDECTEEDGVNGITVHLANTGGVGTVFTVNGGPDIAVGPDASTDVFVPVAEDADYTIAVTADGVTLTTLTGTRDCEDPSGETAPTTSTPPTTSVTPSVLPTEVQGVQITRALARTGISSQALASLGEMLLALGVAFVALARRRAAATR